MDRTAHVACGRKVGGSNPAGGEKKIFEKKSA